MNVLTLRINSWLEARILADELSLWVFRGQQDASWSLSTALQRGATKGNTAFLLTGIEEQIIEEFQRRAHHFLQDPPELAARVEWLALIQHFGGPTRLLDFTRSFYVAAFFAAERALTECAIWCVNSHTLHEATGRHLGLDMKESLLPHWQLLHRFGVIAQEMIVQKPSNHEPLVFEVQPFRLNERLSVQQGVFLCPLSVNIPFIESLAKTFGVQASAFVTEEIQEYNPLAHTRQMVQDAAVIKAILPVATHHDVLQDLRRMNVTAASLFPGLDGFARSLHYFLRDEDLWQVKYDARRD
jgi:hypothetical protein